MRAAIRTVIMLAAALIAIAAAQAAATAATAIEYGLIAAP
ncbi:hypothetical protein GCM10022419_076430 [Nonomuraea rosea]|uniref:Uncharacterized protein n=1 Tax=Nonomuraea rosea TaxID=638574 RepID=A0ABP6YL95_9ACTN